MNKGFTDIIEKLIDPEKEIDALTAVYTSILCQLRAGGLDRFDERRLNERLDGVRSVIVRLQLLSEYMKYIETDADQAAIVLDWMQGKK